MPNLRDVIYECPLIRCFGVIRHASGNQIVTVSSLSEFGINFEKMFSIKDENGNTILMELAKNMKDDALREILTNSATVNFITHLVLLSKNTLGQTLLTLIEVIFCKKSLSLSLSLFLTLFVLSSRGFSFYVAVF